MPAVTAFQAPIVFMRCVARTSHDLPPSWSQITAIGSGSGLSLTTSIFPVGLPWLSNVIFRPISARMSAA